MAWRVLSVMVLAAMLQAGAAACSSGAYPSKPFPTLRPPPRRSPLPPPPAQTVFQLLTSQKDVSIATAAMLARRQWAPLLHNVTLSAQPSTLFVPTDAAYIRFARTLGVSVDELVERFGPHLVDQLVDYHFVPSVALTTTNLPASLSVASALPGYNLTITKCMRTTHRRSCGPKAPRAIFTRPNLLAGKTVIHIVDRVLEPFDFRKPPAAVADYATLGAALQNEGLNNLTDVMRFCGLEYLLRSTSLEGTLFAPTDAAWNAFFGILTGPSLSNILNDTAVDAFMAKVLSNLTYSAVLDNRVFFDHLHMGEALSLSALSSLGDIAVGSNPALYNTTTASKVLIKAVNGTLQLAGVTTANIVTPNLYVGSKGKLVVHTVDGVLVTYSTAQELGVLLIKAPAAAGRRPLRGA